MKLIPVLFEKFALLIDLLVLTISDAIIFWAFLCYLFCLYLHARSSPTQRTPPHHPQHYIFENLPSLFAVRIWRRNMLWLFAMRICHRNLPWEFATGICYENLLRLFAVGSFVFQTILFCIYEQSCLYGSKKKKNKKVKQKTPNKLHIRNETYD